MKLSIIPTIIFYFIGIFVVNFTFFAFIKNILVLTILYSIVITFFLIDQSFGKRKYR